MITIPNLKIGVFHQLQSSEETAIQKVLRLCNIEKGKKAQIYILYYNNTVDEEWAMKAIKGFNPSKIKYLSQYEI